MLNIQEDILKELGIDGLPPAKQEEILTAMTEVVLKRITLRLLSGFSGGQKKEFADLCASGDQEKINHFFAANVPDYENLIKDEVAQFKKEMDETVETLLA